MNTFRLGKKIGVIILMLLFVVPSTFSSNIKFENDNSSLVILKIKGLDSEMADKIASQINKTKHMSLEYSCLQSDVIVLKYAHDFANKGDVQHFINSHFKKWLGVKKIEFIFIDIQSSGVLKC